MIDILNTISNFLKSLKEIQENSLFTWRLYPFIVIGIDVTVAYAPIKNIISQLPLSIHPYFPVIAISTFIVFFETKFGNIRQEIKRGEKDPYVDEKTQKEILWIVKLFIYIIPAFVIYEGAREIANHIVLEDPKITYLSTSVKYLGLAFLSYSTHRILFLYAHKIDFSDKEKK